MRHQRINQGIKGAAAMITPEQARAALREIGFAKNETLKPNYDGCCIRLSDFFVEDSIEIIEQALQHFASQPAQQTIITTPNRHEFKPDKRFPWFCSDCGYGPREMLMHTAQETPAAFKSHGSMAAFIQTSEERN